MPAVSRSVGRSVSPPVQSACPVRKEQQQGEGVVLTVGLKVLNIGHAVGLGDDNPKRVD